MQRHFSACLILALLAGAAALPASTRAQDAGGERAPVARQADALAVLFRESPEPDEGYAALFGENFLSQVPAAHLTGLFEKYFSQYGPVTRVEMREERSATSGVFSLFFEEGYRAPLRMAVSAEAPHRITGARIGVAEPFEQAGSLAAVAEKFAKLPGEASFMVAKVGPEGELTPQASHRPGEAGAIGSAFKLYVLGTLVRQIAAGERAWTDVVRLKEPAKSLPSGSLHTWPEGAPLTLHTLATLMISKSDNTATDLLLRTLGRKNVQAMQERMGHAAPSRNAPFLTTRELFVLKSDSALAERYLAADSAGQRALLADEVTAVPRAEIDASVFSSGTPTRIETLEWFASARDLGRALAWFQKGGDAREAAREILAVNPGRGLDVDREQWPYVGFKGGSEPGVLSANFLLRSDRTGGSTPGVRAADGTAYVLSATQNNPGAAVDQAAFFGLVQRAVRLAGGGSAGNASGDTGDVR